jgi:Fur family zinc uptake transcriptional regulator
MTNDEITIDIIKKSKKNLTAYEILDKFQKVKKVQPMTVYRSLKNLMGAELIHKSNLNKSYILCNHSHKKNHNSLIAICKKCGSSEELTKDFFSPVLKKIKLKNFKLSFFDLEILTNCRSCQ